ncbi:raffinose/stachyose/melibiose transport system permease protein [Hydrogenispora ethanolica]|uniref:Raffinose/stachyose/melibiose transport system permease protein n=1 Tax=Hydrogenispora ethanolica TaxID=1082276 RepID=A0A4R1SB18_HYDET|nr:sugar ABC transporter permease [Hydrogenispora ethanolica]TCL76733.1 raffinose/stachyose/melibiose transport system permease protein [Hydrogenispora ethanolica]
MNQEMTLNKEKWLKVKGKKFWTEERRAYLMLVTPAALLYYAVMAFPFLFSLVLSFTNYTSGELVTTPIRFIGLKHYLDMLADPYFWISLTNNFYIVFISVFGQIPLGFVIAYILHRKHVKMTGFFQTMIYFPTIISTIVVGILWQSFFSPYGPLTEIIQRIIPAWENNLSVDPKTAMIPVLLAVLWMYTGNYLIIFLANLQKIDPEVMEASKIDGASEGQVLRYIVLPALSGVIVTCAILAISGSLNSFGLIFAMTQGNPARRTSVLSLYMYDNAFRGAPDYGLANAISIFMVLMSFAMILITKAVEKKFGGRE